MDIKYPSWDQYVLLLKWKHLVSLTLEKLAREQTGRYEPVGYGGEGYYPDSML